MATTITKSATDKIHALMLEEGDLDLMLRVYISGGGCSGFKYGFSFELDKQSDDYIFSEAVRQFAVPTESHNCLAAQVMYDYLLKNILGGNNTNITFVVFKSLLDIFTIQTNMVKLLVDPISYQYLKRAVIDFKSGIDGEYFTVINPDAKTTCGCGSSFSIDMSEQT